MEKQFDRLNLREILNFDIEDKPTMKLKYMNMEKQAEDLEKKNKHSEINKLFRELDKLIHPFSMAEHEKIRNAAVISFIGASFNSSEPQKPKQNEEGLTKDDLLSILLKMANELLDENKMLQDKLYLQDKPQNKTPKRADDLSGLKVGDKVWSYTAGWGIVTDIDVDMETVYPINVKFHDGSTSCFTINGFEIASDINQSLFLTEIKYEIPTID